MYRLTIEQWISYSFVISGFIGMLAGNVIIGIVPGLIVGTVLGIRSLKSGHT